MVLALRVGSCDCCAWRCCSPGTPAASHAAFVQRHRDLLQAKTGGANIKVLGIGGGGSNAVNRMVQVSNPATSGDPGPDRPSSGWDGSCDSPLRNKTHRQGSLCVI